LTLEGPLLLFIILAFASSTSAQINIADFDFGSGCRSYVIPALTSDIRDSASQEDSDAPDRRGDSSRNKRPVYAY